MCICIHIYIHIQLNAKTIHLLSNMVADKIGFQHTKCCANVKPAPADELQMFAKIPKIGFTNRIRFPQMHFFDT